MRKRKKYVKITDILCKPYLSDNAIWCMDISWKDADGETGDATITAHNKEVLQTINTGNQTFV